MTGPGVVPGTTHPAWHLVAAAAAAIAVFGAIKIIEWRDGRRARAMPRSARTKPSGPMVVLALSSLGGGAVHAAACPSHFREAVAFGVFFLLASAAQAAWAIAIICRPSRELLIAGAIGNAAVVALWALTRTVGLPIGPELWRPEAISTADALATQLEVGIVIGVWWTLHAPRRLRSETPVGA